MKVLVNGLPFFSQKLVRDLNEFDSENSYVFYDTYSSKLEQIKFALALPTAGAVISSNGVTDRSKSLDLTLKFKKKLIMQWHGTDVKHAVDHYHDKTIDRKYIDAAKHLVSAPWFVDELKEVIRSVEYAPFGYINEYGKGEEYTKIKVLSYFAKGRENFYGWKEIESAARKFPDLEFTIVGSEGEGLTAPNNVSFLGWISEDELFELMCKHAIFLRLTEHDGKAISVSQALGAGCEVVWTYAMDNCHQVTKGDEDLIRKIDELINLLKNRGLTPNKTNIAFAKETLNRKEVMTNFVAKLKGLLNE
ncbi:MAG: hypothetical protein QNK23_04745 [Crocinitomicaceae bacterium]|nr:hypothetical protein [Crocinitomicaceae bacterium]